MQNSDPITRKIVKNVERNSMFSLNNMENSPKGLLRTSGNSPLWGRCPALTQLLQLITPSRASGTADHVRSLDNFLSYFE